MEDIDVLVWKLLGYKPETNKAVVFNETVTWHFYNVKYRIKENCDTDDSVTQMTYLEPNSVDAYIYACIRELQYLWKKSNFELFLAS